MYSPISSNHEKTSNRRPEITIPTDSLNEMMKDGPAVEKKTELMAPDSDALLQALHSAVQTEAVSQLEQRTIIHVDDFNFDTMHNLLSCLYTGCVNLHYLRQSSVPLGALNLGEDYPDLKYPERADAFLLYRAANMYMLQELENRCYHYLCSTCTGENIIERLFDCLTLPNVGITTRFVTCTSIMYTKTLKQSR